MQEGKKARLSAIVFFIVSLAFVLLMAIDVWIFAESKSIEAPRVEPGLRNEQVVAGSIVNDLSDIDNEWVIKTNLQIQNDINALTMAETDRLYAEQQAILNQQKEYNDILTLQQQQQALQAELDRRAEEHIKEIGGVEATKGNEIQLDEGYSSSFPELSTPTPIPSLNQSISEQYSAKFVCTCAECFVQSEWADVEPGSSFIYADSVFIQPGVNVVLSQGSTDIFEVKDADGRVTGRDLLVFNVSHVEGQIYLTVSEVE